MKEINQQKIEAKWQKKWEDARIFETNFSDDKEKYFGTVAYPYANSILHIGHGKTNVTAEIFLRFQRLLGKNVLFPMGFHISGTPVLAVADAIRRGDEKQIKITREAISEYLDDEEEIEKTLKSFSDPQNIAKFFSSTIEDSFKKVGIGIDWRRKFTTGEPYYNKFIDWQYTKLKEKGILTQGKYPILFSPKEENAVGEDDIKDGDTDKVTISEMRYILFKRKSCENEYFAVATLRPDALFGTTNLWIGEDMDIVKVRVGDKIWIVSKEAFVKLKYQFDDVELISTHKGSEFVGEKVITPIIGREVVVAKASFLDPYHGTGLAYSSPAGSPHDFQGLLLAKKEGRISKDVEVINTVETFNKKKEKIEYRGSCPAEDKCLKFGVKGVDDEEKLELAKQELYKEEHYGGRLNSNAGEFEGMYIKEAKFKVGEKLEELGLGGILLETSRRAKTRSGDVVIVANIDGQWFLDYSSDEVKRKAFELLDNMLFLPEKLKETQKGYLQWVQKRPCARKRGLGTPLLFDKDWVIEPLSDSTIYQILYLIIHIIRREKLKPEQLSEELFDYLFLDIGNVEDVSKKTEIDVLVIDEMKKEVDYWQGLDLRYVGQPHMSNHMSFLIYHYALIFDTEKLKKKFHPKIGIVGGMLLRNGEKISKSKGNGVPLSKVSDEFGADLYRLYIAVAASFDAQMDFRDDEIEQLRKKFDKFKELVVEAAERDVKSFDDFEQIDKWLISRFYSKVKLYFEDMGEFRIREAFIGIFYEVLNDINYHMRRTNKSQTLDVLRFFLKDYLLVMTPAIPHITEEVYCSIKQREEDFISVEKFNLNFDKFIDKELEEVEAIVENLISSISRNLEVKNIENLSKIVIVQAPLKRFDLFDELKGILNETKNFKEIMPKLLKKFGDDKKFISKFVPKTLGEGLSHYLSRKDERKLIEEVKSFIENEFNTSVEIKNAEEVKVNSNQLIPTKPMIILE